MKTTLFLIVCSLALSSCNVKIDNDSIKKVTSPLQNNDYPLIDDNTTLPVEEIDAPINESEPSQEQTPPVDNNQSGGSVVVIPFEPPITPPSEPAPNEPVIDDNGSSNTPISPAPEVTPPVVVLPPSPDPVPTQPEPMPQPPVETTPEPEEAPITPPSPAEPPVTEPNPQPVEPTPPPVVVTPPVEPEPEEDTSCNSDIPTGIIIEGGVVQDWGAGYKYEYTITNNQTEEVPNWTMCFYYNHQVVNPWNATAQGNEPNWKITPLSYNQKIPVGNKATIGWIGSPGAVNNEKIQSVIFKKEANFTCPILPNYCNQ